MRAWIGCLGLSLMAAPACAQEPRMPEVVVPPGPASDEKAAELKVFIDRARVRQQAVDRHNTELWRRWTYAVCIGCGGVAPGGYPSVFTTPARVLAGIPAAEDDARARRMRGRTRRA